MPTTSPIFFPSFPPPGFSPELWRMPGALPALPTIRQNHPLGRPALWVKPMPTTVKPTPAPSKTSPSHIATCPRR
jgi:hypothetical protein